MLQRIVSGIILLICILPLPFCKKGHSQHRDITLINPKYDAKLERMLSFSVPLFSVKELHEQLDSVFLIDARERREFDVSHIPGAQFGGYKEFDVNSFSALDKDQLIVTYCSVGYRSEKIGEKMRQAGFTNVHNLYGSIFEWVNNDYPLVNKLGEQTDSVHTYNRSWGQWVDPTKINKVH